MYYKHSDAGDHYFKQRYSDVLHVKIDEADNKAVINSLHEDALRDISQSSTFKASTKIEFEETLNKAKTVLQI